MWVVSIKPFFLTGLFSGNLLCKAYSVSEKRHSFLYSLKLTELQELKQLLCSEPSSLSAGPAQKECLPCFHQKHADACHESPFFASFQLMNHIFYSAYPINH